MIIHLVGALASSVLVTAAAEPLSRRLRPAPAARLLTAMAVVSALLVLWALAAIALAAIGTVPWLAERLGWCRQISGLSHALPWPVTLAATGALATVVVRATRLVRRRRAATPRPVLGGLDVVASSRYLAYAVPGRPGHIVTSTAMLGLLSGQERRAMLAHEQAHLDHGHHRYLRAADLAACVPPLGRVARAVRYATERWADEEAARTVGDRRLVARALTRAALAATPGAVPLGAVGLVGTGMLERVEHLVERPVLRWDTRQVALVLVAAVGLSVAGAVTIRPHDVATALAHFCGIS